jgi:hypothetical protein
VRGSLFQSSFNTDFGPIMKDILSISFYSLFGNFDYFNKYVFTNNCTSNLPDPCDTPPNNNGVLFAYITLPFYLITMNYIFINLLISSFKYKLLKLNFINFKIIINYLSINLVQHMSKLKQIAKFMSVMKISPYLYMI